MHKWEDLHKLCKRMYLESEWKDAIGHAENTLEWLLKINPEASEEMKIAAYSHDIERTLIDKRRRKENEGYMDHKLEHSKRSADIVSTMMFTLSFPISDIKRVHYLISSHEVGGDEDANDVRDADSLSYFENNLTAYYEKRGKEGTQTKIKFMYSRASDKAKELVKTIHFQPELKELMNETLGLGL